MGILKMKTVTLEVASREQVNQRLHRAFQGEKQGHFISFETPTLLFKVLTSKRWEVLKIMTGAGPLSIRETARRLGRDVKAVHRDVQTLLKAGLLSKTMDGRIEFPFEAVHVDFMLAAA